MPLVCFDVDSLLNPSLAATTAAAGTLASVKLNLQQTAVGLLGPPQEASSDCSDVPQLLVVEGAGGRQLAKKCATRRVR